MRRSRTSTAVSASAVAILVLSVVFTTQPAVSQTINNISGEDSGESRALAVDFGWTPINPEIGENILFSIEGLSEDVVQATWDFGGTGCNGEPASQVCVSGLWDNCKGYSFKYASGGDKTVSVAIETASGTINAGPHAVTVSSTGTCLGPTEAAAQVALSPVTVFPGQSVTVADVSLGSYDSWAVWATLGSSPTDPFAGGYEPPPSGINPHSFSFTVPRGVASGDEYWAHVEVANADPPPQTPLASVEIGIDRTPQASFSIAPAPAILGDTVTLTATAEGVPDTYKWTITPHPPADPFIRWGILTDISLTNTGPWKFDLTVSYLHTLAGGAQYQATATDTISVTSVAADFSISPPNPLDTEDITLHGGLSRWYPSATLVWEWEISPAPAGGWICPATEVCIIPAETLEPDTDYTITLTLTNTEPAPDDVSFAAKAVHIGSGAVNPTFSWEPASPEIGDTVLFTIQGLPAGVELDSVSWRFDNTGCDGGGAVRTCTPTIWTDCKAYAFEFSSGGNKDVTLRVTIGGTEYPVAGPFEDTVYVASSGSCGGECTYRLTPSSRTIGGSGGDGTFSISTTSGCSWTASSNRSWITILSGFSGTGVGTVTYRVATNSGAARTGTISAGSRLFTINQRSGYVPVNFTMSNPTPMIGEVVTFTVDSALRVGSWNFGEVDCQGNSPEFSCTYVPEGYCNNIQWSYPTSGAKSVTMRLTDGRIQTKTPIVRDVGACCMAAGRPDASFTMGKSTAYAGESVSFTDTSTGVGEDAEPVEWQWTLFLDSVVTVTSNQQHFIHSFDTPGVYLVELNVSNCLGSDTAIKTLEILEAQIEDSVFPAALSLEGALGTHWESDFRFFNPCEDLMAVRIEFQPEGTNNSEVDLAFRGFTLDAGETTVFSSIFEAIPGLGGDEVTGSVRVESSSASGCKVLAVSRTFNDTPDGTLGLFVPALPAVSFGEDRLDFTGLIHTDDYRTNLRLVNFGDDDEWVQLIILDRNGNPLTPARNVKVKGQSTRQLSEVASWMGIIGNLSLFSIQVTTSGAPIDGVVTVIDNITGDSVLYRSSFLNENMVWIAGVAHIFGLNEAQWRTDICLYNPTEGSLLGELEYVVGATPDDRYGLEWPALGTSAVRQWLDIAGFFLGGEETQGYLVSTGNGNAPAPQIAARTYNADADGGTYGLSLPTFGSRTLLKSGDTGFIVGISNSEDPYVGFRTNLGLLNTDTNSGAAVRITMFDVDGSIAGEPLDLWLPPGKMRQFQVFNMLDFGDVTMTASIRVEVLNGTGVAAYATEIDNRTNDSIYNPALKAIVGSSN